MSFVWGVEGDPRWDQSLDIKSLRRLADGAKTVETKAQAIGVFITRFTGIYKLCLFIAFRSFLSLKIFCKIGHNFLIIQYINFKIPNDYKHYTKAKAPGFYGGFYCL